MEVDGDLDTIYGEFNGNITDVNINAGAAIDGSKIAVGTLPGNRISNAPNGIDTLQIDDGAVTGTKIANAPNGIDTANINDLAVTTPKIAVKATTRESAGLNSQVNTNITNFPAEAVFAEIVFGGPARGGFLVIQAAVNGYATNFLNAVDTDTELTVNLRLDGTAGVADGTIINASFTRTTFKDTGGTPVNTQFVPFSVSLPTMMMSVAGTAHRLKLCSVANNTGQISYFAQGFSLYMVEFA